MVDMISVNIDASDIIHDIEEFEGAIELANKSAVARIEHDLRSIIRETVEIAFEESGLHPIYQNHLRQGIKSIRPYVYGTPDGLIAEYYDIEGLGDYEDLEQGFHYHAILDVDKSEFSVSNPQRVELPYAGEDLYNEFEKRYAFWLAVIHGEPVEVEFGGGKGPKGRPIPKHKKVISTTGLYIETLNARVQWWGNRYPEWLLLEYGTDTEPVINPTHFKELLEERVSEYMTEIYEEILDSIVSVWEQPTVSRNSAGRLINERGQFVKYLPDFE